MTNCTPSAQLGRRVQKRTVHLNFDGGDVSTNGGSLLLKAADDKLGLLDSVAKAFVDNRDPARVKHRLHHLIKQRVFGLACGYEDLNDHDQLRHDGAVHSDRGDRRHAAATLCLLVKQLRAHWPDVRITFRGDAGFQSALLLDWCDRHRVEYIMGFGGNVKLKGHYQDHIDALSAVWEGLETEDPGRDGIRIFDELPYQAGSWKRERRVIAKLEHNVIGANQRYIVTSLEGDPEHLYSDVYCERGTMENRHKEAQMGLFADRTSCHEWWANQLRVMFSALAYTLLQEIRQTALKGTKLAKAQVWTLREQLLKIGAVVVRNTRRIELRMNSNYLHKELYMLALTRLGAT